MFTNELEIFFRQPGEVQEMRCRVCGAICGVERGAHGPTCWAEALAGRKRPHDRFTCPRAKAPWHDRALRLVTAINGAPSRWLAAVMRAELQLLRLRHLQPRGR